MSSKQGVGQASIYGSSGKRALSRLAAYLKVTAAIVALLSNNAAWAQQLPTGGTVAAGSATIGTPQNGTLNINQSSNQAVINWNTFSVSRGGTVNFNQPGSSSATMNRVTGSTPSWIAGTINAPGTVLLVNPNGIAITKSGVINTGSFAASTLDISNADFMAGKYKFTGNGGSAAVRNSGRINVSDGGFAALLGGQVANDGVISARLGKVGLGAGELITLDLAGDGFLSVAVPSSQMGKLVDSSGALISNRGKIRADGGSVFLTAATASTILRDAVNVPGSIRANTVGTHNGRIVIGGGDGGRVSVTGKLAANGNSKRNGGKIEVSGANVALNGKVSANGKNGGNITVASSGDLSVSGKVEAKGNDGQGGRIDLTGANIKVIGALIDASGTTGGGLVRIGGTFQGGHGDLNDPLYQSFIGRFGALPTIASAQTVTIDAGSKIDVSAKIAGDGGSVVIWSDQYTSYSGTIVGTSAAGNGGFVEVSSHGVLDFSGNLDLSAAGDAGTLLLDPANLSIVLSAPGVGSPATGTGNPYTANGDNSYLLASTLTAALASANVTVSTVGTSGSQTGDITVSTAINWTASRSLTLNAAGSIFVNAAVTATGTANAAKTITLNAGADITTAATVSTVANGTGTVITMTAVRDVTIGGALTANGGTSTGTLGTIAITANRNVAINSAISAVSGSNGAVVITAGNNTNTTATVTEGAGGSISTSRLRLISAATAQADKGAFTLTSASNSVTTLAASVGSLAFSNSKALTVGTVSIAGLTVSGDSALTTSVGAITVSSAIAATNGLSLTAATNISNSAAIVAGTLTFSATGTVTQTANITATNLALLGTGSYTLTRAGNSFGTVAANAGSINLVSSGNPIIGTVGSTAGITSTGAVTISTPGSLTINGNIVETGGAAVTVTVDTGGTGTGTITFGSGLAFSSAGTIKLYANGYSGTTPGMTGGGTLTPYTTIYTLAGLQNVNNNLSGNYALMVDIDASATAGAGFVPIGGITQAFTGSFDGQGHTISNLTINLPSTDYVGLFGLTSNATITNVGLVGGSITGRNVVGGLVGLMSGNGNGILSASYSTASVSGVQGVGGLVGKQDSAAINQSYSTGAVSGTSDVGGLVGAQTGDIFQSYATGAVTASGRAGGLVGSQLVGDINQSYATGAVNSSFGGGLVGGQFFGTITASFWDTQTTGKGIHNGVGNVTDAAGATGLTSAQFATASSFAGWTFGTTAGGSGWVIVDADSTLNNAGGAAGATRPFLLSEASTNGVITNAHQMQLIALNLAGSYKLGNDINMSETGGGASSVWFGAGFVPLGNAVLSGITPPDQSTIAFSSWHAFTGTFDGQNHTISNLTINRPSSDFVGLFGYISQATVKNVALSSGSVTGRDYTGGLIGEADWNDATGTGTAQSTLFTVSSGVNVNGRDYVGGLLGYMRNSQIDNGPVGLVSSASGNVSGRNYVGGLLGFMQGDGFSFLGNVSATGNVNGNQYVGGLIGYSFTGGYSTDPGFAIYATGNVTGVDAVGGLVGWNSASNFNDASMYATGNVTGTSRVGGFSGFDDYGSLIANSFATGSVTGVTDVGGLSGRHGDNSDIKRSFATGFVSGTTNVGGLVGYSISRVASAYATGAVYGTTNVGGLVGNNDTLYNPPGPASNPYPAYVSNGQVTGSYSIGYVKGTTNVGGLIGSNSPDTSGLNKPATVLNSYWNTDTAGVVSGIGATNGTSAVATGLSTSSLQTGLKTGFTSDWGIVAGASFPYLTWLYSAAPQVVSGFAYSDRGTTPLVGTAANMLVSGLSGTAATVAASGVGSTGANGYFYFLAPNGTFFPTAKQVLVYTAGASGGATFNETTSTAAAATAVTGLNIYGSYLKEQAASASTLLSTVNADRALAVNGNAAALARLNTLANLEIDVTAASFAIDQAISTGTLLLSGTGTWTELAAITATTLSLLGSGATYTLTNAGNAITNLGTVTLGSGSLNLVDTGGLTVTGVVGATGGVTLNTSGALAINNTVNAGAGNVSLTTTGAGNAITQSAGGAITANTLALSTADGNATLDTATNAVSALGNVSIGNGALALKTATAGGLAVPGASITADGGIAITNTTGGITTTGGFQLSNGAIALTAIAGNIVTGGFLIANGGSTTLTATNGSITLGGSLTGTGVSLTSAASLTLNTNIFANSGNLLLTATGAGSNITQTAGRVQGAGLLATALNGSVDLTAGAAINAVATIAGRSGGNFAYTAAQSTAFTIGTVSGTSGIVSSNGNVAVTLTNSATPVTVGQAVTASNGDVTLWSGGNLAVNAAVTANTGTGMVSLVSAAGAISQSSSGVLTGNTLTLSTTNGSVTLNAVTNAITNLGTASVNGALNLLDAGGLTVTGAVVATGGITLQTSGALAINAALSAGTGNMSLTTTGAGNAISQNVSGIITANTLTLATNSGSATLNTATNAITNLGTATLGSGALNLLDAGGLTVTGVVGATGGITLNTSGALVINAVLNPVLNAGAGNVSLTTTGAGGNISQGSSITANALTIAASGTVTLLTGNNVRSVGGSSNGAFNFTGTSLTALTVNGIGSSGGQIAIINTNSNITVAGALNSGGGNILVSASNGILTINGVVTATGATVAIQGVNGITQGAGGIITATNLLAVSGNDITLTANNVVGNVSIETFNGGSSVSFTNTSGFVVGGTNTVNFGPIGDFAIDPGIRTSLAGSTTLTAGGNVTQATGLMDIISTGALILSSAANANFTLNNASNAVTNLGAVSIGNGGLTLVDTGGLTVTGAVVANGGATIRTTGGNLTIGAGGSVASTASGDAVVLSTDANFINNRGAGAVQTPNGRWLVYSAAPAGNTFGNLDSNNNAIWNATYATLPPGSVTQPGNRYIFAAQPTLTFTSTGTLTKTYGDDATAPVAASNFTLSGLQGVANAFTDTASGVYSGAPTFTSAGSAATANVTGSPYSINGAAGSLAALNGYAFAFVNNGTLTVTPATLTFTANTASRNVGDANPTLSGSIAGFKNGQTATSFGGDIWSTLADQASPAGSYAVAGNLTNAAPNYRFVQVAGNLTALTVNALPPAGPNGGTDGPTDGNSPSQFNSRPDPNGAPKDVNISFQPQGSGPISVSFTPPAPPVVRVSTTPASSNIEPASLPPGQNLSSNNGLTYLPISQFDANQYSQFKTADWAAQAGEAAIFVMIARGADQQHAADAFIDGFWNGTSAGWTPPQSFAGKVTFSDGAGNSVTPSGNAGFPIAAGATDFGQLLKNGPVMISDGATPAHWLLATQLTSDGKGIVANDPASGKQVVLNYDAATKTVGGVTSVFDANSNKFVPFAEASAGTPSLAGMQGFAPASFLAVSTK